MNITMVPSDLSAAEFIYKRNLVLITHCLKIHSNKINVNACSSNLSAIKCYIWSCGGVSCKAVLLHQVSKQVLKCFHNTKSKNRQC